MVEKRRQTLNILAIAHELELNGASLSLMSVLLYLKQKHSVYLFVPYREGKIIDVAKENHIPVIAIPYHKWMVQTRTKKSFYKQKFLWYLKYSKENDLVADTMANFIREKRIDVVYTNTRVIDLGVRLQKLTGIKHVWHIREFGEEDFHYRILDSFSKHWSAIKKYTDVLITNSKSVENKIKENTEGRVPILTIYNGVDDVYIYNRVYPDEYKTIRFLIAGRICRAKGHDLLIKAIHKILDNQIVNFEVYIAGAGNIQELCGTEYTDEVAQKCRVLGFVDKIWEIRKNVDVELMCSRNEAFGRVTIEAMFSGLLVIGSNSGGTAEIIDNMRNGILFTSSDADDLAMKMAEVIKNPSLINKIAPRGQKEAISRYRTEKYCKDVSEVIVKYAHRLNTIKKFE